MDIDIKDAKTKRIELDDFVESLLCEALQSLKKPEKLIMYSRDSEHSISVFLGIKGLMSITVHRYEYKLSNEDVAYQYSTSAGFPANGTYYLVHSSGRRACGARLFFLMSQIYENKNARRMEDEPLPIPAVDCAVLIESCKKL